MDELPERGSGARRRLGERFGQLPRTGPDEGACVMKAHIGDQVIVASAQTGAPARTGSIVELRHPDGTPPYVVRWDDTGHDGVYFPGTDGRIESVDVRDATIHAQRSRAARIKTWVVDVELVEEGDETTARALLRPDDGHPLESRHGRAVKAPRDDDLPLVGDQVAVARALRHLSDSLLAEASRTMSHREHRDVILTH